MSTKCELRAEINALETKLRYLKEQLRDLERRECEIKTLPWGGTMVSRSPGKVCVTKTSKPFFIPGLGLVREETSVCRDTDPLEDLKDAIIALNFR